MPVSDIYTTIPGWLTADEAHGLYNLARKSPGAIFEAGTFCGRSTSVLCEGIRDSRAPARTFVSYDLAWNNAEEYCQYYRSLGHAQPNPATIPRELTELWTLGTNSTAVARQRLSAVGLLPYVDLQVGDFRKHTGSVYHALYFDVVHDEVEIQANLPHILRLAAPHAIVAIHDMQHQHLLESFCRQAHNQLQYLKRMDALAFFQRI